MKKSILVLILAFSSFVLSAQSQIGGALPSWWKGSGISETNNQIDTTRSEVKIADSRNNSDLLNLVVQAVAPSLKVVKQLYRLKKDEDYFGKDNLNHFGESLSLGVKVAGGVVLQHTVMYPWLNDRDYIEVNSSGIYTPVLYKSLIRPVTGGEYESIDLELDSPYVKMVGTDSLLYLHYDTFRDFGLYMDTAEGKKSGYLLWVKYDAENISFSVDNLSVEASLEKTLVPLQSSNPSSVLGGVFVVPVYEIPGTVSFHVAGVVSSINGREWKLKLLTMNDTVVNIIN